LRDPFVILGLSRGASAEEVKRAYRRQAMRWHPDRNPTRETEEQFKSIKAAYELLLDAGRRHEWESKHPADTGMDADHSDHGDDGEAFEIMVHLDLEEAAAGCTRTIALAARHPCDDCQGQGHIEHRTSVACAICRGVGQVRSGRSSTPCGACKGRGYVRKTACPRCTGNGWIATERQIQVRIPAGTQPGERLRLPRQHRPHDGPAGDLFVIVAFHTHPFFTLDGKDLHCDVPVNLFRLLHAGPLTVPTLTGMQEITIEPYPGQGLDYCLPGLGYPGRHGRGAGQLCLHLRPVFPQHLSDAERKLLLRLEKAMLGDLVTRAPELAAWERKLRHRQSRQE
jgi:molecular chaperone DnaJ